MARGISKAARVYARTFLEFAAARNETAQVREELEALREAFAKVPAFGRALNLPGLSGEKRALLLKPVADKASEPVKRLLKLLEVKGRLALLPEIVESWLRLEEAARKIRRAQVTSAVPMTPEQLESLAKGLAARAPGSTYLLQNEVDASLIAGFRVEEEGLVTDTSLRHQLEEAHRRLVMA
ncbi:MAG TPA: ATP synthase F1 subunit delta [Fibrobacteria bacterium]|nr:ATP synthase F1 subunit delta [Fibrobacteria bacterium]